MALESVYLIVSASLIAKVIATYASSQYFQYAGYPTGYMYTAQSYTPKPAPAYAQQYASPYQQYSPAPTPAPYQQYSPAPTSVPTPFQPPYASPSVAPSVPATKYQQAYAQATPAPKSRATSYQPAYTPSPVASPGTATKYQQAYNQATAPSPAYTQATAATTPSAPTYAQTPARVPEPTYQPIYAQLPTAARIPEPTYQPTYAQTSAKVPEPTYAQTPTTTRIPEPTYSPTPSSYAYQPTYQSATPSYSSYTSPTSYTYQTYPQPPTAPPVAVPTIDKPYVSKESSKPDITIPPFDSNVLNNLAIALQLLIVSNLIHNPPNMSPISEILESDAFQPITPLPIPYVPPESSLASNPYDLQSYSIPNANFLGSTGFTDTGISKSMMSGYGSPTLAPRTSGLMSPYDAIAKSSYSDTTNKKESKSPYHLSSDYNDLFSLTELFKI